MDKILRGNREDIGQGLLTKYIIKNFTKVFKSQKSIRLLKISKGG